jgi:lipopolysaccharide transport system permease protein
MMKQVTLFQLGSHLLTPLWQFRHFIYGSVRREFQARYANSLLGFAWPFLQPAVMILIYTIVFSRLMGAKIPGVQGDASYSIYLCAGLIAWNFNAEMLGRFTSMFVDNANLLKKVSFPWFCLPVIAAASSAINHVIIATLLLVIVVGFAGVPLLVSLHLIPLVLVLVFFASGLGLVLAIFNVFFRDVGNLLGLGLQLWFWLTPVVYPVSILPEYAQRIVQLNPLLPIVEAYQHLLTLGAVPEYSTLAYPAFLSALLWVLAVRMSKKRLSEVVDEL